MKKQLYVLLLAFICFANTLVSYGQNYTWNQVRIGGSGAIPSFVAHPKVPDLYFVTTDVGTPYRWNKDLQKWEHMMLFKKIPVNYWRWEYNQRCGGIAVDPNDVTGNILYAMVEHGPGPAAGQGNFYQGTVMKSTDRGDTWTDLQVPIAIHPNDVKTYIDRIQVDPSNSNVVWVVTDTTGAWRSENAGSSWTKQSQVSMTPSRLCTFILFDTSAGTTVVNGKTVTKRIYLGRSDRIDVSNDGGLSFSTVPSSPAGVTKATIHGDGTLYVASHQLGVKKAVYKYRNGSWQEITPIYLNPDMQIESRTFAKVAVNPANSNDIVVGTFGGWQRDVYYLSGNGGNNYITGNMTRDNTEAPHSLNDMTAANSPGHGVFTYTWDPFYPNRVWLTDLLDVISTDNIHDATQNWKIRIVGLEEIMVTGPMMAPPSGKNQLLTVTADVAGAHHRSLTEPLNQGAVNRTALFWNVPLGLNTQGVAFQYSNPNFVVRAGQTGWDAQQVADSRSGYSTDGGDTYTRFPTSPGLRGRVAVSATSQTIVWMPQLDKDGGAGYVYWSDNLGTSWTKSTNAPRGALAMGSQWLIHPGQNHLVSDKVNGNFFYIWDRGKFYVSQDAGRSFQQTAAQGLTANNGDNPNTGSAYATASNVETTPGATGDVWIAYHDDKYPQYCGLYHTTDTGRTFNKVGGPDFKPKWVAAAMSDTTSSAHLVLYVTSASFPINGVHFGAFRSDDTGRTWTTILDRLPGTAPCITADNRGRMIVAAHGNGIFFGTPSGGPVQAIEIVLPALDTLVAGFSTRLTAKLTPTYPTNPSVTWSSSDTAVAKVNQYGNVTGISPGTATIAVTSVDGAKTDSHTITVVPPVISTGIQMDSTAYGTLQTPAQLIATPLPANTTNKTLLWSVGNTAIATVSSNGIVTGKQLGITTLTVTAADGGATRTVPLKITLVVTATNAGTQGGSNTTTNFGQYIAEGPSGTDKRWHAGYTGTATVSGTIDSSLVTEPAPGQVYQTIRTSKNNVTQMRYHLRGLIPNANYGVRLHFVEPSNTDKLNRIFSVKANNSADSLSNFNPYAAAGNKLNTVVTRTLQAKANNSGVIEVWFYPKVGQYDPYSASIAAVEARIIPLQAIALSGNTDTLSVNHTDTLRITTNPLNATNSNVVYSTSDTAVATVGVNGVVSARGAGTVTITATSVEGNYTATKSYTVVYTPVSSVTLNLSTGNVFVGDTLALMATVNPVKASNKTLNWTSTDSALAKVTNTGRVIGVKQGDVIIRATSAADPSKYAQANMHITNVLATAVALIPATAIIGERDTLLVKKAFTPANTSIKTLSWSSSDTTVAKVDTAGIILAIQQGTATITATTQDNSGVTATLPVTVVPFDSCGGIKNPGFESDLIGWATFKNDQPYVGAVYTVSGKGHTGDKAVTMGFPNEKTGLNIKDPVPVRGGSIIVFSKWVNLEAVAGRYPDWSGYGVGFVNSAGVVVGTTTQRQLTGVPAYQGQWALIKDTLTVPDSATGLTLWIAKVGPGTVWLDDFCIDVLTTNHTVVYAVNAGTEQTNTSLPATPYANTPFAQYQPEGPTGTDKKWHAGYTWIEHVTAAIDLSGVVDPAPPQVYEYLRMSKVNITPLRHYFRNLAPNTDYLIRLHFVEPSNAQKLNRIFSVKATNGYDSLMDFNPYQAAGNVLNKAVVRTLTARADANGLIMVFFYPKTGTYDPYSASVAAVEVRTLPAQSLQAVASKATATSGTDEARQAVNFATAVYPNPTEKGFTVKISSPSAAPVRLTVVDNSGRQVYAGTVYAGKVYQLGENWKAGIYHLTVQQGTQRNTTKIVKQ